MDRPPGPSTRKANPESGRTVKMTNTMLRSLVNTCWGASSDSLHASLCVFFFPPVEAALFGVFFLFLLVLCFCFKVANQGRVIFCSSSSSSCLFHLSQSCITVTFSRDKITVWKSEASCRQDSESTSRRRFCRKVEMLKQNDLASNISAQRCWFCFSR